MGPYLPDTGGNRGDDMLDVCLLGSGGMMPSISLADSADDEFNGSSLLIDCGEGTQIAIKEKGWSFKPIDVICFTHFHGDHISGLPGLLLTMGNADRREPLTLIGPKGLERGKRAACYSAGTAVSYYFSGNRRGRADICVKWIQIESLSCKS